MRLEWPLQGAAWAKYMKILGYPVTRIPLSSSLMWSKGSQGDTFGISLAADFCRVYSLAFPPPEGVHKAAEPYTNDRGMGAGWSGDIGPRVYTLQDCPALLGTSGVLHQTFPCPVKAIELHLPWVHSRPQRTTIQHNTNGRVTLRRAARDSADSK